MGYLQPVAFNLDHLMWLFIIHIIAWKFFKRLPLVEEAISGVIMHEMHSTLDNAKHVKCLKGWCAHCVGSGVEAMYQSDS